MAGWGRKLLFFLTPPRSFPPSASPRLHPPPASPARLPQMADTLSEILKKVRKIELITRGIVRAAVGGEYHSVFKGQGIDFDDFREYAPGDEVRSIDWNVTARMGFPYIKKFVEER